MTKFIDYDTNQGVIYNNLWIDEHKIVIKMPLMGKDEPKEEMKLEEFDLAKYTYLLAYE